MSRFAGLLLGLAAAAVPLRAQDPGDGSGLAVYLVTFGPGPRIWERFGHNALWIRQTATGDGVVYDYGRFDFRTEHFFTDFVQGRSFYAMGREDGVAYLNAYIANQRAVTLQELNLGPAARLRLASFLEANYAREQGRYRYDYYRDNCSTRIRDAIDSVVGGAVRATLDTMPSGTTYRFHTRRSYQNSLPTYFGVTALIGPATDQPISAWQEAFLPLQLRDHLRDIQVPDASGHRVPLVKAEIQLADSPLYSVPDAPADWRWPFLAAGLGLGGVLALLGWAAARGRWIRRSFLAAALSWSALAGIAGFILLYFWAFTDHAATYRNQNIWQLNLFSLALLPLLPAAARREERAGRIARGLAALVAGLALLGLVAKGLPGMGQANGDIVAFTLPVQLGLAAGIWALVSRRSRAPS